MPLSGFILNSFFFFFLKLKAWIQVVLKLKFMYYHLRSLLFSAHFGAFCKKFTQFSVVFYQFRFFCCETSSISEHFALHGCFLLSLQAANQPYLSAGAMLRTFPNPDICLILFWSKALASPLFSFSSYLLVLFCLFAFICLFVCLFF